MSSTENTVLQLLPPKVHLQTRPIEGADIGVPLHAVIIYPPELVFKRAQIHIDPPLSGTVQEGDDVRLYSTLDPALVGPVKDANFADSTTTPLLLNATTIQKDVNAPIRMYIKESQFRHDVIVYLFYTITRGSENVGASSSLSYIWNRIRPGMKDDVTVPGGHAKLKLLLPDAIKNGVGPDFVTARVAVQYPFCRAYDRISFMCNGKILEVNVGPTEAPEPPDHGSETPTTIYFDVDRAFLELAKQQDKKMAFLFTVYDQLNNSADPDAQWSPPQIIDEDLDGTRFAKPILREQLNDPSDTPEINLGKLKDQPLKVVIVPADARFEAGYQVRMFYTATHPDHTDVVDEQTGTVIVDEFGQKQLVVIEVPNQKVIIAGSTVKVFYELREPDKGDGSPGDLVGRSNTTVAQVVGFHLDLKQPSVLQANDTTLAPLDALSKLTIVVPQGTTLSTDLLSVCWTAKPGTHTEGSIVTAAKPISEIGLNNDISPQLMAFSLGDVVSVSYIITRDGEQWPSETLSLTVQNLPQSALIAPRLKEADSQGEGSELKLANLTPQGKMWCPGFPLNAEGQFVWLLFKGTNADGSPYENYIWAAPFAYVNEQWVLDGFFEALAPYGDLIGLMPGRPLTMVMFISFGKSQDLTLAKRFMERTYSVSAVEDVAPTIESITATDNGEEIPNGGTTVETAVTLSGVAAKGQKVDVLDGTTSKGQPTADPVTGVWTLLITALDKTTHVFVAKELYGAGQSSDVYTINVVAMQPPVLLSPAVTPIDVLAYEQGVILRVIFPEALPGDEALLAEEEPLPGSVPFPSMPFNASKTVDFQLPSEFLVTRRGSTRRFRWALIRNSIPTADSPDLTLVINAIAVDDPRLPISNIAGELGQQLNVSDLPDDARVLSEKIPLMQQGHPVWVDFEGVDAEGNPETKEVSVGGLSELADRVSLPAPVEWLKTRKHESELRVVCAVNLDGIKDKTKAVPLPVRTYTMNVAQALTIDPTPMVLDGPHFYPAPAPYTPTGAVTAYLDDNAHRVREALGGVPPYHYSSSNTNVASVNATTGDVVSTSNGTARIDVRDAKGNIVSYEVVCNNVYELVYVSQKLTHSQAINWMLSIGAQLFPSPLSSRSTDPLIRAAGFGFQKTSSESSDHWHTSFVDSWQGTYSSSKASPVYIAQWHTPPYRFGLSAVGNSALYTLSTSIGYRLRNR